MAKKNEKLDALLDLAVKGLMLRNTLIWAVVRFALCMAIAVALLIGVELGRML